jgi:lycopene beta-cyclase
VIAGAGCAGLSLLVRLLHSGQFNTKRILLIDKGPKQSNDRTWCYWEKEKGYYENLVFKRWDRIAFYGKDYSTEDTIEPYQYKMIRGIDFYQYCFSEIDKYPNVEVCFGKISNWQEREGIVTFNVNRKPFIFWSHDDTQIFNSIYQESPNGNSIRLLQHFKGWVIEMPHKSFDPNVATMMDFRVPQEYGTTFGYVLPFTESSALVEYTVFSKSVLNPDQYNAALKNYIENILGIENYSIREEEMGVIPMTNQEFKFGSGSVWYIGTAGGQTKASSGYTFQFIQKQSDLIAEFLINGRSLKEIPTQPKRFRFYDNTLLHILYYDQLPGKDIFTKLFQKNKPQQVLGFLHNETSLAEELKLISCLPAIPFLKAAVRQL